MSEQVTQKEVNFWLFIGLIASVLAGIKSCIGCDKKSEKKDDEKQEKNSDESSLLFSTEGYEIVRDDGSRIEFSFSEKS